MNDDSVPITRRDVLRGATLVSATAIAAPALFAQYAFAADGTAIFKTLSTAEGKLLATIVERLIPTDATGPGAKEAHVAQYIDLALGNALAASRPTYAMGLAALDRYAATSRGKPFLELTEQDQISVLIDCETGGATGFTGSSAQFFGMLLNHTKQGMFGDPYYGGNANFVGWDLINYPGVRTGVSEAEQRALENNTLKSVRNSAYDYGGFTKAAHHD